jgi:hypothetical protein
MSAINMNQQATQLLVALQTIEKRPFGDFSNELQTISEKTRTLYFKTTYKGNDALGFLETKEKIDTLLNQLKSRTAPATTSLAATVSPGLVTITITPDGPALPIQPSSATKAK